MHLPGPPHFLDQLHATFASRADCPALFYHGRTWSYGELEQGAACAAALLQNLGMTPGDRVALCTPAKLPFLLAHLGVMLGGGVSLPLNPRFTYEELGFFLADSGARMVVAGEEQQGIFDRLRTELPDLHAVVPDGAVLKAPQASVLQARPSGGDPCLLMYSSGTTGWPKGVVHSHANLAASLQALADCWRFTPDDVVVNVLPLFHIHGLSFGVHLSLVTGGAVLVENAFHTPHTLDAIGQGTVFMAVPTIYYRLLEETGFREQARSWGRVRLFTCGSAPIRPEVLPGLEEILGRPIINRYGMTEAHVITSLPLDGPWPHGSVGLPLEGVELKVARADGTPSDVSEVGSVLVRGPTLFREYWRQPEASRQAFVDGWFQTGDLGYREHAGFLTLVGRSNDLIITNGYNVYPQVVERVINGCPGVRESAVVGVPDEMHGERIVAVVVRDDLDLDASRLRAWWGERLVDYQQPRQLAFLPALPRNAMGKVLRNRLREDLQKGEIHVYA
jgi:malonyl-CoA/methylmalonyl-CoA synthetase